MRGIQARAARAAKIAAAAVLNGDAVNIGPVTDLDALEAHYGVRASGAPAAPAAPASVARGDARGFLDNLAGIAAGKVKVVS